MTGYKILAMAIVIATLGNTINIFLILKRIDALEFIQSWIFRKVGMKKWIEDKIKALDADGEQVD